MARTRSNSPAPEAWATSDSVAMFRPMVGSSAICSMRVATP